MFHVSFENGTPLTPEEKSKPWNAVGIRMLYQLLSEPLSALRRKYDAKPDVIFRLVAMAEHVDLYNDFTGILVVDGIQKAITWDWDSDRKEKDSGFYGFLTQIGGLGLM